MAAKRPAKKAKGSVKKSVAISAPTMPGLNGGTLRRGSLPGNTPGTGRPPDAIRAAMRELGVNKGLPFLADVLAGKIPVDFIGKCPSCRHEHPLDAATVAALLEQIHEKIGPSVDQRLKATEQAWKYGLGAKELVIASGNAASFFDCVHTAIVELHGEPAAEQVKARALVLMEGVK